MSSVIKRGYYRIDNRSVDVRRCPDASTNCSEPPECSESTSGCRGTVKQNNTHGGRRLEDEATSDSSAGCYNDLEGIFCRLCAPRPEGKRVYYAVATRARRAQCRECRDSARKAILAAFGYAAIVAVVFFVMFAGYMAIASNERKRQLRRGWQAFTPHIKAKICIGFYMIVTKIDTIYEVGAPSNSINMRARSDSLSPVELALAFAPGGVAI